MSNAAFANIHSKAVAAGFAFDDGAVCESARRQFSLSLTLGFLVLAFAALGAVRPGRETSLAAGLAHRQVMAPTFMPSPPSRAPAPARAAVRVG
ncbi:MAG: hypothetical protein ABSC22_13365 [Roseiarcus sp.]|jgi:hypothetical protein